MAALFTEAPLRCELSLPGQGTKSPAQRDPLVRLQSSLFTRARHKHRMLLRSRHSRTSHAGGGETCIHSWLLGAHACTSGRCSSGSLVVLCPYTLENGKDLGEPRGGIQGPTWEDALVSSHGVMSVVEAFLLAL